MLSRVRRTRSTHTNTGVVAGGRPQISLRLCGAQHSRPTTLSSLIPKYCSTSVSSRGSMAARSYSKSCFGFTTHSFTSSQPLPLILYLQTKPDFNPCADKKLASFWRKEGRVGVKHTGVARSLMLCVTDNQLFLVRSFVTERTACHRSNCSVSTDAPVLRNTVA